MSIPGAGNPLLLGGAGGYKIERSLRFNSADSAYLSRTPASASNRKTWTISLWCKRSSLGGQQGLIEQGTGAGTDTWAGILFNSSNQLVGGFGLPGAGTFRASSAVYRDTSAWYHIVLSVDTTQASASDRIKLWVNNDQVTTFSDQTTDAQNTDSIMNTTNLFVIGQRRNNSTAYLNGYLADIHFIDGQALDPTSFGEFDDNGVWQPKAFSGGSYGTNGFHLDFADNSSAAALGYDAAGSNDWTVNNLSVTAGAGNDSLVDSPTNYGTDTGAGAEVRGNYATLNPISLTTHSLSNGNLDVTSSALGIAVGTVGMSSGKWYWEFTLNTVSANVSPVFGYVNQAFNTATAASTYLGSDSNSGGVRRDNGQAFQNNTSTSYTGAAGFTANDVAMIAFDADAKKIWIGKNGTWYNSGAPASGTGNIPLTITGTTFFPAFNTYGDSYSINFGQRPFAYTAPSGFKALCTQNLPTPTITKPSTVMDVALWTGNGSARSITGLGFNPDLVWIKGRSGATDHALYDSVRGTEKRLESNTTDAEVTSDGGVTAFNSDGFSLGTLAQVNTNSATYAGWTWDESVSAGFDIVTYTGNGTNRTIAHSLNVAPQLIFVKRRDTTGNWQVYHTSIAASSSIQLNSTAAAASATTVWNSTAPTSTVFSVGTSTDVNANSGTYVAYCFAPVAGYSAFGSYTGNGSSDGPMVFTNMRPRWIMLKRTDSTSNWTIIDTAREGYNVDNDPLYPNLSDAEGTTDLADILSNGFKLRSTDASVNANTGTYVYACFAESPFALARAR